MTPAEEANIVTLLEQSHTHLKDLILRVERTIGEVRGEIRDVRVENQRDHAQVMTLVVALTERVDALEDGERDEATISAERRRFRRQLIGVILAANTLAATAISLVAVFVVG